MTFWSGSGSGSADPCLCLMDPDSDLDSGSGSCFFRHRPSRCQTKNQCCGSGSESGSGSTSERYGSGSVSCSGSGSFYHHAKIVRHNFPKIKSQKESQNSMNQDFSYYFCTMTERSGSGSIPLTNGSGSGRPKNLWIRWILIRNTACGTPIWFPCMKYPGVNHFILSRSRNRFI
jgi:hypothetical protein